MPILQNTQQQQTQQNDIKAYLNTLIAESPEVLNIDQMPDLEVVQEDEEDSDTTAWKLGNPKGPVGGAQVPPGNIHYGQDSWQNMQEDAANKADASFQQQNSVQAFLGFGKNKPSRTQQAWSAIKNHKGKIAGAVGAASLVGGGYYMNKRRKARSNPVRSMYENQALASYEPARLEFTNPVQAEEDVNQVMSLFGTPNNIQAKGGKVAGAWDAFKGSSWNPLRKSNPGDMTVARIRERIKNVRGNKGMESSVKRKLVADDIKKYASQNKGRVAAGGLGVAAVGGAGYGYNRHRNKTKSALEEAGLDFNDITAGEFLAAYDEQANQLVAYSQDAYINLVNAADYAFQTGDIAGVNAVLADIQDAIDQHENAAEDLREAAEVEDGAAADAKEALADYHEDKAEDLAEGTEEILSALAYNGFQL